MLSTAPIRAYIPVADVARARKFYEQTVGLTPKEEFAGGVIYECGGAEVFMYPTSNAGTSRASQAFWEVDDVEAEVAELKARGVVFEGTTCRAFGRGTALPSAAAPKRPGSGIQKETFWPSVNACSGQTFITDRRALSRERDVKSVERAAYSAAVLLLVSGVIHLAVLVISGGTWEGPLSLRKPTTFGLSFGLTLVNVTWIASFLPLKDRSRPLLLGTFASACMPDIPRVAPGLAGSPLALQRRNALRRRGRADAGGRWIHTCCDRRGADRRSIPPWQGVAAATSPRDSSRLRSFGRRPGRWRRDDRYRHAPGLRWRSATRVRDGRMAEAGPRCLDARHPRAAPARVADLEGQLGRGHTDTGRADRHRDLCAGRRRCDARERIQHRVISDAAPGSQGCDPGPTSEMPARTVRRDCHPDLRSVSADHRDQPPFHCEA